MCGIGPGLDVTPGDGVGLRVGIGVEPDCAQYLPLLCQ
jgi:hypothetical protein